MMLGKRMKAVREGELEIIKDKHDEGGYEGKEL